MGSAWPKPLPCVLVQISDGHVGAFTGKGDGHGAPDAAVGPGDQRDLVGEPAGALVAFLAAIGVRIHFFLRTWHSLGLRGEGRARVVSHINLHSIAKGLWG